MFKKIVEFFTGKKAEAPVAEVPYKVETPATPAPSVTVDGHGDVHEVATATAPKKAPAKKPAVTKPKETAPAKPRAPRKPKAPN